MKLKLNKKFSLSLREEFRFGNNISTHQNNFTEIGVKYKLNKHFSFVPRFRYAQVPLRGNKKRISFDTYYTWKQKGKAISFRYRLRLQKTNKSYSNKEPSDYLRNKFHVGYNASKLVDPFFAYELYFRFDQKNEFRRNRYTLGLDWKVNKQLGITTYYRIQNDINVKRPEKLNIIGLSLSYNMALNKKKYK